MVCEFPQKWSHAATTAHRVFHKVPLAGGDEDYSILSQLNGTHSIDEGILGFLTMYDSNSRAQHVGLQGDHH